MMNAWLSKRDNQSLVRGEIAVSGYCVADLRGRLFFALFLHCSKRRVQAWMCNNDIVDSQSVGVSHV